MDNQGPSVLLGAAAVFLVGLAASYLALLNQYAGTLGCCIPGIVGGLVAVWHYTDVNSVTLSAGSGAKLGAIAGALGGVLSSITSFILPLIGLYPTQEELFGRQRQQMVEQGMSEEQIDAAMQFTDMFASTGARLGFAAVAVLVIALVGAAGGAIGAGIFKKGDPIDTA